MICPARSILIVSGAFRLVLRSLRPAEAESSARFALRDLIDRHEEDQQEERDVDHRRHVDLQAAALMAFVELHERFLFRRVGYAHRRSGGHSPPYRFRDSGVSIRSTRLPHSETSESILLRKKLNAIIEGIATTRPSHVVTSALPMLAGSSSGLAAFVASRDVLNASDHPFDRAEQAEHRGDRADDARARRSCDRGGPCCPRPLLPRRICTPQSRTRWSDSARGRRESRRSPGE